MIYYVLAFLIWICKILMWLSIIFIPLERYLSDIDDWWEAPFYKAYKEIFKARIKECEDSEKLV